jgi:hypothetical protein
MPDSSIKRAASMRRCSAAFSGLPRFGTKRAAKLTRIQMSRFGQLFHRQLSRQILLREGEHALDAIGA